MSINKKVNLLSVSLILFLGLLLGFYFIRHEADVLNAELDERTAVLLNSLTTNSEYPILIRDREAISRLAKGILTQRDVAFCRIEDIDGTVLFEGGRKEGRPIREFSSTVVTNRVVEERDEGMILGASTEVEEEMGKIYLAISLSGLNEKIKDIKETVAIFTIVTVILVSLLSSLLLKLILSNPIHMLVRGTERIARGDLDHKVPVKRSDEIGILAVSFNKMTADLKATTTSIANLNKEIVERKRAEEKTRKEREFSEALVQSICPDVLIVVDKDRNILGCNGAIERMFGYLPHKLIGKKTDLLYENRNRDIGSRPIWKVLDKRGFHVGEAVGRRKDGSRLDLEISTALIKEKRGVVLLVRDITDRKTAEKMLLKAKEQAEEAEKDLRKGNDKLKKVNRELKEAQSQLLQREKLASIGQLAAGIAHEINNPAGFVSSNLNSLQGYISDFIKTLKEYEKLLSLCKQKEDKDLLALAQQVENVKKEVDLDFLLEDIEKTVGESLEGTKRITKIVRDLKDFSHIDEAELKYADINEGIESTLNIVWNELKYKAEVIKEYGDLPEIECYPQQLNQVFMNLLVNAAQAIEEKGQIRINTFSEDDHIHIQISDTGMGIPQENLSRIFEPFFTTKEVGKGTGLGLSMSYGIIQKHQGKIDVKSQVGKGTTFTIELPVQAARKEGTAD